MLQALPPSAPVAETHTSIAVPSFSNALEMQYARPWLDAQVQVSAAAAPVNGNALELQYAQPWLNMTGATAPAGLVYSNALEIEYAKAWLPQVDDDSCQGRLDTIYACRFGR